MSLRESGRWQFGVKDLHGEQVRGGNRLLESSVEAVSDRPTLFSRESLMALALYHFDEGTGELTRDSSGSNRHGTIFGANWQLPETVGPKTTSDEFNEVRRFEGHMIDAVVFMPDGRCITGGFDETIRGAFNASH